MQSALLLLQRPCLPSRSVAPRSWTTFACDMADSALSFALVKSFLHFFFQLVNPSPPHFFLSTQEKAERKIVLDAELNEAARLADALESARNLAEEPEKAAKDAHDNAWTGSYSISFRAASASSPLAVST